MRGQSAHGVEGDRLPVTVSCVSPHASVQRMGKVILWSRAVAAISTARRRMVSADMPVISAAHSGVQLDACSRSSANEGRDRRAVLERVSARERWPSAFA